VAAPITQQVRGSIWQSIGHRRRRQSIAELERQRRISTRASDLDGNGANQRGGGGPLIDSKKLRYPTERNWIVMRGIFMDGIQYLNTIFIAIFALSPA
jgi:hypothetical protein